MRRKKQICIAALWRWSVHPSVRPAVSMSQQGPIHGNPVEDGWAGAVPQKPLGIRKCDGRADRRTDRSTRQGVESRVRD